MMAMSMNTSELLPLLAASLCLAAVACALIALRRQRRQIVHLQRAITRREQHLRLLRQEFAALLDCSRGLANQLGHQQLQLRQVNHRQQQLELNEGGEGHVREAVTLVRRGAGVEELVGDCGLSRSEAELVLRLHGREEQEGRLSA
ncbi:MAG: DUF2802 domain-containing protein [Gammaproteobacteria bacterium]|nr:MAG: DUF2802 domain-containing protein [Gammaproteobacteria bacterium]